MMYEVTEYRSIADTYEVDAYSEENAEDLVAAGKGTLVIEYAEHDFYEVNIQEPIAYKLTVRVPSIGTL